MPFLLNEDEALKAKFANLLVTDVNAPNGRGVLVRFRLPETELGSLTFPIVVINHTGIEIDHTREHRGFTRLGYAPEGFPLWATVEDTSTCPYWADFPIPYNIGYQITALTRKAYHRSQLVAAMMAHDVIPDRFGYLAIPNDGTVRRLDVTGGPELSVERDADGKRLFATTWTVDVSAELLPAAVYQFNSANQFDISLTPLGAPNTQYPYQAETFTVPAS